ncbi:hypothetical protein N0V90_008719 [Kalmusia sp. IMI 367209]|nr:hypothetical protein N0V90_008719 [Kalmusia sp. IMI 367209]
MTQNAKVAGLTDGLIHSILNFDPKTNRQAYRHAKEVASKGLRAHQYARTNQFDVQASFAGLDEKFRVLNRDDLADALDERVNEINKRVGKWIPECLSLLLQLSDRPTENSRLEALELLRAPTPPPELTWKEILDDDPYSDEDLWKDIDYAAGSSDDEVLQPKKEKAKVSLSTSAEEDDTYDPEGCVVAVDANAIEEIREAQFWRHDGNEEDEKIQITELQAVRETLFMLAGLHTSLYRADGRMGPEFELSHSMTNTTKHLLSEMRNIARKSNRLRQWVKRPSSLPLVQTFEAAVSRRLLEYDQSLALIQRQYLVPECPTAVSLLDLHNNVRRMSRPILRLAEIVAEIEPQLLVNPFVHLETLFDQISLAQMTLEQDIFDALSHIFFECLQTYLKPMRRWMESGELGLNDETFFVFENDSSSEASSLWHDRFVLRRGQENALRSPAFLEPAAQKIFNTGKSVVFLKELGIRGFNPSAPDSEPRLDHETVCGTTIDMPLSPFSELFQAAFQTWIGSKYSLASNVLREYLFNDCGLVHILNNFRIIYLSANGFIFQDFADAIFERMDTGQKGWNDRFLLTELARGIFSTALERSEADRVVVRSLRSEKHGRSVKGLANVSLDYALPWPVMNIIQRSSISIYQQLFTFLLQTYRAKYLLQRISPSFIRQIKDGRLCQLSYKLRQRLIWFADVLRSYLTETVIDSSFEDMKTAIVKAEDIDEMSNIHVKYVARLQDQALLSENLKPIYKAIISLLDLAVLFSQHHADNTNTSDSAVQSKSKPRIKPSAKSLRRKSFIPAVVEHESSDSDNSDVSGDEGQEGAKAPENAGLKEGLDVVDREFGRLLPFVTAGLRSVGRVGAEPVWEMLAEMLEWEGKKERR